MKKGFFSRAMDAIVEARMRQVDRELRMQGLSLPEDCQPRPGRGR